MQRPILKKKLDIIWGHHDAAYAPAHLAREQAIRYFRALPPSQCGRKHFYPLPLARIRLQGYGCTPRRLYCILCRI